MALAEDYLDELEAIEAGVDDTYNWCDRELIKSFRAQLDLYGDLSDAQKTAIHNIFEKGN
jgi:hypothetical protein